MDKFEYKIYSVSRVHLKKDNFQAELMQTLNQLGEESWELVNVEGLFHSNVSLHSLVSGEDVASTI